MAAPIKLMGVHIDHPHARDRLRGEQSTVSLSVTVGKSDVIRAIPLAEGEEDAELVRLIADAAKALAILRGVRR